MLLIPITNTEPIISAEDGEGYSLEMIFDMVGHAACRGIYLRDAARKQLYFLLVTMCLVPFFSLES